MDRPSKRAVPRWCRQVSRSRCTRLGGAWLSGEASDPGRTMGASDIEFVRFSDHGHYVLGSTGTGKTHLATGLAVEACRQRKRVRFTTAAELVNELIEAKNQSELNRVTYRWLRYQLIVIDEMAYVAMPESAAPPWSRRATPRPWTRSRGRTPTSRSFARGSYHGWSRTSGRCSRAVNRERLTVDGTC